MERAEPKLLNALRHESDESLKSSELTPRTEEGIRQWWRLYEPRSESPPRCHWCDRKMCPCCDGTGHVYPLGWFCSMQCELDMFSNPLGARGSQSGVPGRHREDAPSLQEAPKSGSEPRRLLGKGKAKGKGKDN